MTTTFLIGNGIGMTLNPEAFSLEKAMKSAFDKLELDYKKDIQTITSHHIKARPKMRKI